jgi:hypothetical protein
MKGDLTLLWYWESTAVAVFLAEDRESGQIVEDTLLKSFDSTSDNWITKAGRRFEIERSVGETCRYWSLDLIDFDWGSERLWRLGFWRPKWAPKRGTGLASPPHGIAADRWHKRLKSTDELKAYRAGVEAAKASLPPVPRSQAAKRSGR